MEKRREFRTLLARYVSLFGFIRALFRLRFKDKILRDFNIFATLLYKKLDPTMSAEDLEEEIKKVKLKTFDIEKISGGVQEPEPEDHEVAHGRGHGELDTRHGRHRGGWGRPDQGPRRPLAQVSCSGRRPVTRPGGRAGIAAWNDCQKNKLDIELPFTLANSHCGYAICRPANRIAYVAKKDVDKEEYFDTQISIKKSIQEVDEEVNKLFLDFLNKDSEDLESD